MIFVISISLFLLSEQAIAQAIMSPKQQMMMGTSPDQITCTEDKVLMMKSTGNPVCVHPNSYLRLVDRGWGDFDMNMMTNNQQMQSVMNSMMDDPELRQQMMDNMVNNPQMMQSMMQNQQFMQQLNP